MCSRGADRYERFGFFPPGGRGHLDLDTTVSGTALTARENGEYEKAPEDGLAVSVALC